MSEYIVYFPYFPTINHFSRPLRKQVYFNALKVKSVVRFRSILFVSGIFYGSPAVVVITTITFSETIILDRIETSTTRRNSGSGYYLCKYLETITELKFMNTIAPKTRIFWVTVDREYVGFMVGIKIDGSQGFGLSRETHYLITLPLSRLRWKAIVTKSKLCKEKVFLCSLNGKTKLSKF